ncbi:hypothetical protein EJB05_33834, partial [Eragrostis curvula]
CDVGHVVCLPCCDKLKATGKCYSDTIVECTDLSNGLPVLNDCFQFIVPDYFLGDDDKGNAITVKNMELFIPRTETKHLLRLDTDMQERKNVCLVTPATVVKSAAVELIDDLRLALFLARGSSPRLLAWPNKKKQGSAFPFSFPHRRAEGGSPEGWACGVRHMLLQAQGNRQVPCLQHPHL